MVEVCEGCGVTVERNADGYWADQFGRVTCGRANPFAVDDLLDPFHEPAD